MPRSIDFKNRKVVAVTVVIAVIIVAFASYLVLSYLEKAEMPVDNNVATPADSSSDQPSKHQAGSNQSTVYSNEVPAEIASVAPAYEGATLAKSATNSIGTDGKIYTLSFHSDKSRDEVIAFYQSALNSNGWKIHTTKNEGGRNLIGASRDEGDFDIGFTSNTSSSPGTDFQITITTAGSSDDYQEVTGSE